MGSARIGALRVDLGMNTAAFEKGVGLAERELNRLSKNITKSGEQIAGIGKRMTLGLTAPIVGMGVAVVKMTGDFDGAMNRVSISTQGTAAQMKGMADLALKLGKDTLFGATEAADAMDMLAKNGLSATQILDGAAAAAVNLATAAGSELSPAADAITDVMQQFKLETKDLPKVVNLITGAVNESKLDFRDFALAIGQAGGVAGSAGVEFDDFNAAIAATSSLFASGSDAGTSFKTFITRLTPDSKPAAAAIERLGLKFFDATGSMKSMAAVAEELKRGLSGLSEQDRTATLKAIFGVDAMRTAIGLMDQGADGIERLKGLLENTDAAEQAAKRMASFNGQIDNLKGAIETLAIRVGQSGLIDTISAIVRRLADFIDRLSEASPGVLRFATVAAVLVAALGPVAWAIGSIMQVGASLIGLFAGLSVAALPVAAVVAAVAAAGYLIYKNWDSIEPVLRKAWQAFEETLGPPLREMVSALSDAFGEFWNGPLGSMLKVAISKLLEFQVAYANVLGPVLLGVVKLAIGTLTNLFRTIGDGVRLVSALLEGDFATSFVSAGRIIDRVFGGIPSKVIGWMAQMVVGIRQWVVDKLGAVWRTVTDKVDAVKSAFFDLYDAVVGHSYIPDMVDGIAEQMNRLDAVMVSPATKAADKVKEAMRDLADDTRAILDRLFPEVRQLLDYRADLATLDRAKLPGSQDAEARRRLGLELAGYGANDNNPVSVVDTPALDVTKGLDDVIAKLDLLGKKAKGTTVQIAKSFADMARDTVNSLQNLANSIKGGGFLDILGAVINLGLQLGSVGAFGKKVQTNINSYGGARAAGGPVSFGKSYLVGENGPEMFSPGSSGAIVPNHALGGSRVEVIPSPYFNVVVDGRIVQASPAIMAGGAQVAQSQIAYRRTRRVA